jgi:hypothetical protein
MAEDPGMRKTARTKPLRDVWSETTTVTLLARWMTPMLVRHLIESVGARDGARRRRVRPRGKTRRSLLLGSVAVGVAAAGAAAARIATRDRHVPDDIPEIDRP